MEKGAILRIGKGKLSRDAIEIRTYTSKSKIKSYDLFQCSNDQNIAYGYYYKSLARGIGLELIRILGEALLDEEPIKLSIEVDLYVRYYTFRDIKLPFSFTSWRNSEEGLKVLSAYYNQCLLKQQRSEYSEKLWKGNQTLGWIPIREGGISGMELAAIFEGRPIKG